MTAPHPIFRLDPASYRKHRLHCDARDWQESNCYIDVWIEVIHALGLEVEPCLGITLASDFEGDQWTFFKPRHAELEILYGIGVDELTVWRRLVDQCVEQVRGGKLPLVEMDSFYLPDTQGTDYRNAHVKTTIAIASIDADARRMGYFHNTGYHVLEGEDFDGIFRLGVEEHADYLPPYAEIIKVRDILRREPEELRGLALELAARHYRRRPRHNPFGAYADRMGEHLEDLVAHDLAYYHSYIFASVRQAGANFEFAAKLMRWLARPGEPEWEAAADAFASISETAKMLIMKTARIANSKRVKDLAPNVRQMAGAWDAGMGALERRFGG